MKEHVRKAAEVLRSSVGTEPWTLQGGAEALDSNGLLRTGDEQAACEACVKFTEWWDKAQGCPPGGTIHRAVYDAGKALIEARKSQERWVTRASIFDDIYKVECTRTDNINFTGTEAQCRAVAEALNKLEAR